MLQSEWNGDESGAPTTEHCVIGVICIRSGGDCYIYAAST